MVVPPAGGGNAPTNATQTTPSTGTFHVTPPTAAGNGRYPVYAPHIPFSARRAPPLDLSTVERRGHPLGAREHKKRTRPHGLQEAPTFRPTEEEFADPFLYIKKIGHEGRKYGAVKIIPPDGWNPPFSIDTEVCAYRYYKSIPSC